MRLRANNAFLREFVALSDGAPRRAGLPERIAGYRVLGELHRGGQGVVLRALHESSKREVALKIPLLGGLSPRQQRRFEREIDLVAGLRHDHIVRLYDSGLSADGLPWFAMELVAGEPLDRWTAALRARLPNPKARVRRILTFFSAVCDAVHAAHRRGIIHRDLKPGNILVDADDQPHVLDFGVAKLIESDGQAPTRTAEFVGTLAYAAPEQVQGDPERIDTRTDVYALGVLLFQALTDQPPYACGGSIAETIAAITDARPPRPSALRPELDDEIDTIVLKALAKERERRYASVDALRADLAHYLAGEPIDAKRDSAGYLLRKQLWRYRGPVAAAAVLLLAISGGLVASLAFWGQAVRERDAADAARTREARARQTAESINRFLQDMLGSADRSQTAGRELTVREVLDSAAAGLDGGPLVGQPAVLAGLHSTIGNTYRALGLFDAAEPHLRAALELDRRQQAPDARLAAALGDLGGLLQARGDAAGAEPLFREAAERLRRAPDADENALPTALNNLAGLLLARGDLGGAEPLLREALDAQRARLGADHPYTALIEYNLAGLLHQRGAHEEAAVRAERALSAFRKAHGDAHTAVAQALNGLGTILIARGDAAAATPLLREALATTRALYGDDHPRVAVVSGNLAKARAAQGDAAEAAALLREALPILRRAYGDEHDLTRDVRERLEALAQEPRQEPDHASG